jgi:hypothetical protein
MFYYYIEVCQLVLTCCFLRSPLVINPSTCSSNYGKSTSSASNIVIIPFSPRYEKTRYRFQSRLPFIHIVLKQSLNSNDKPKSDGTSLFAADSDGDDVDRDDDIELEKVKKRNLLSSRKKKKIELARLFLASIEQSPELIPNSDGMYYFNKVMSLESERTYPLIVRTNTEPFWNAVIAAVDVQGSDGRNNNRICAIGMPGIGKTKATLVLIRMLLERGKTVVYFLRAPANEGYYYEFIPGAGGNNFTVINAYSEMEKDAIESLKSTETYYIVDPGMTKDTCDKGSTFRPKVIIVSSPDERHWGSSEFEKERGGIEGFYMYMPVWNLEELVCAAPFLSFEDPELEELLNAPDDKMKEQIMIRYRLFGGILRHILARRSSREKILRYQNSAIKSLTEDQAERLYRGESEMVDDFNKHQPNSNVMHYNSSIDSLFWKRKTIIASDYAYEKVSNRFLSLLWKYVLNDGTGKMFETYVKIILSQPGKPVEFESQPIGEPSSDVLYDESLKMYLGGCNEIRISLDPITASLQFPMVLYYTYGLSFPFFDLCYFNNMANQLVLIQVTTSSKHDIEQNALENLMAKLETTSCSNVLLCVAVHSSQYTTFPTSLKIPSINGTIVLDVRKINIVGPN